MFNDILRYLEIKLEDIWYGYLAPVWDEAKDGWNLLMYLLIGRWR